MIALRPWALEHRTDPGEMGEVAAALALHFDELELYVRAVDAYMLEKMQGRVSPLDFDLLTRERSIGA